MVDEGVGTVLEALDAVGQAANTVVLFTSDHGEFLGDHYLSGKEFFYDASARVPFIVAGPGIAAGAVSDALVSHLDVTPTCIDITAQPIPGRLEGRSLLPAARDPQANVRDTLFGEMHKGYATPDGPWWSGQKMAMRGKWKYIYYSRAWEGSGTEEELFDLTSDPGEFTNLAAEHPEVCGELRDAILEWLVNTEENRVYPVDGRYPLTRVERPQIPPTDHLA
jgi:arylsulfatase A-like enzyme